MNTLMRQLAKLTLAAGLVWMGADLAMAAADDGASAPVKVQGLRGGTPLNQDNPPAGSRQERDHGPADRDFVQQPPLVPQ